MNMATALKLLDVIEGALDLTSRYGGAEGEHHKTWVIDQTVRILCDTDQRYKRWVEKYQQGKDGPETYLWETGIAP